MIETEDQLYKDLEAVRQIALIPSMLEVICQATGMGFAAVARVTSDRWLACSVRDEVAFGLKAGEELKIETTICHEIRDHRELVVINSVADDPHYRNHLTPKIYGLQSYISVPIILKNGEFFGTLCAIDTKPADVNNTRVIGTFTMFAELLSFHLQNVDLLERVYQSNLELQDKNLQLAKTNFDLDSFVYSASHDLKSPISNIEGLLDSLTRMLEDEALDRKEIKVIIGFMKTSIKRFAATIQDLSSFVIADHSEERVPEELDVKAMVESAKLDLEHHIKGTHANIVVDCGQDCPIRFSQKNFKSILYNLLSNALKYRSPDRTPEILVKVTRVKGKTQLSVTDNGLGIPPADQKEVFSIFKRFHDHVEGSGLGLYIVKRMVEKGNASIAVDSTLGNGTTFTIVF